MQLETLEDLFFYALALIYDAEQQLTEALPRMAEASSSPQLRSAFEQHLSETKEHVGRVLELFKRFGREPQTEPNKTVAQMREHTAELIRRTETSPLRDAALVMAGSQMEHFEMACYSSLRGLARLLGHEDEACILEKTLEEEKKADTKLTELGESQVNIQAIHHCAAAAAEAK